MKREPEQWKPIKGFPNYLISSWGRVWSKSHKSAQGPHLLAQDDDTSRNHKAVHAYYKVQLWKHNRGYQRRVNRLVAKAFVPNPYNYPIVNHKDENKHNNYYKNLEWCTTNYNLKYSWKRHPERHSHKSWFDKHEKNHTPLILYRNLYYGYYFNSYTEAAKFLNISVQSLEDRIRYHSLQSWNALPMVNEEKLEYSVK